MECEEIEKTFPCSFRLVPHNVSGILATLWLTMWTECEEFVSLNEDAYCLQEQYNRPNQLLNVTLNKRLHLGSQTLHILATL